MPRARLFLLGAFGALTAVPATSAAAASPFGKPPVAEEQLADMRGGFTTPDGLIVNMAVITSTSVNGQPVLQTMFTAAQGTPQLTILAGGAGNADAGGANKATASAGQPGPSGVTISIGGAGNAAPSANSGMVVVNASADGSPVHTPAGTITLQQSGAAQQIVLSQPTLEVRHLAGQAFGSVISNSGNDVEIDTMTIVNLEIANATLFNLGSTLMKLESLSSDIAVRLVR